MGAENVKAVYAYWSHLDDRPHRLLVHMALVTFDHPDPDKGITARRYYAHRDALAAALGHNNLADAKDEDPKAKRARKAAYNSVDRALAPLTRQGAVRRVPKTGRHAEYELHLLPQSVDHGERGPFDDQRSTPTSRGESMYHGERGAVDHGERGAKEQLKEPQTNNGGSTSGGDDAARSELGQDALARERAAAAVVVQQAAGCSPDEAAAVVGLIEAERQPRALVSYLRKLASSGGLAGFIGRVRPGPTHPPFKAVPRHFDPDAAHRGADLARAEMRARNGRAAELLPAPCAPHGLPLLAPNDDGAPVCETCAPSLFEAVQ